MCVKKKRWHDKDTVGARIGFHSFQRFYKVTTNAKKEKSLEDFINNRYYNDFVKFGRYMVELNPINAEKFIDHLIFNGIKMNMWTRDTSYNKFLREYLEKELVERALERTVKEIDKWAKREGLKFSEFFTECNPNEAATLIARGRVSPWAYYLSPSASSLLSRLNADHERIIGGVINKKNWEAKILKDPEDTQFAMDILAGAGL